MSKKDIRKKFRESVFENLEVEIYLIASNVDIDKEI
jgi:hypothetical protein